MTRRQFKRLQEEPDDIDTSADSSDQIELVEAAHIASPSSERASSSSARHHGHGGPENTPRRSMHQVDMQIEWPMIDIPQELREIPNEEDSRTRSNSQANAIKNPLKRKLFLLLEDPSSSKAAFAINVWVSFAIVLSAVITTIETIPSFRSTDTVVWFGFETVMVAFFTIEFIARIICHSDSLKQLKRFLLSPLAIIDFLAIVPYYIELALTQDTSVFFRFTILRLFRLLRVFRTFKYSSTIIMTIEVMIVAIKRSMDALSALFFFFITGTMFFSTLLYFTERGTWDEDRQAFIDTNNNPSTFDSIPSAFWFVMVTITTTGYGDMVPTTFVGKLISFPAMMCGILLITLPSIIIGRNFTLVWEAMQQYRRQNEASQEEQIANPADETDRHSFDSRRSYEHSVPSGVYSSLTAGGLVPGQQEMQDNIQAMTQVAKQNQQTLDAILKLLETHDLVPKKSPFDDSVVL
ncbi:hypothetical protein DFQ27_004334 [Actinomortierella ambigua]|uniref:Ion transport domain-containing protein n=1 Tax=Actinomortierella ambigua TaxID=1343610 RepID=A0A9P6Q2B6_9FUNG|nr:hypothetical protein DFQ26_004122 [Actinomortierella ambigua]KAG0259041.1 hypothetical protein DFQ27_004334 [Actinomortierella ambigua]